VCGKWGSVKPTTHQQQPINVGVWIERYKNIFLKKVEHIEKSCKMELTKTQFQNQYAL